MPVVYAPIPKNAACPKETCPVYPPRRFQLCPRTVQSRQRISMWRTYGLRTKAGRTARTTNPPSAARRGRLISRPSLPEEAAGQEDEDEDEDDEAEGVLVAERDVDRAEGFREPEDDAAEDGPRDVAETPEDRDDERLQRERPADLGKQVVDGREERSGGAHEGGAETERDVRDPLRVDAHEGRGTRVLRGRADHPAEVRVPEEKEQGAAQDESDPERDEHREAEGERDGLSAGLDVPVDRLRRVGDRDGAVIGGEREEGEVREDEADPDREEHLVLGQDRLGLHDRGDEPLLEHRPEEEENGDDDQERDVG